MYEHVVKFINRCWFQLARQLFLPQPKIIKLSSTNFSTCTCYIRSLTPCLPAPLNADAALKPEEHDHGVPGIERNGGQWTGASSGERSRSRWPSYRKYSSTLRKSLRLPPPQATLSVIVEGKNIVMPATPVTRGWSSGRSTWARSRGTTRCTGAPYHVQGDQSGQ